VSGLSGGIASLKDFTARLRELPATVAIKVATAAAPALTDAAHATFDAGEDAYGATWATREDGSRATLRKSGTLEGKLRYVAVGTRLRVALATSYAKYVLGKRPALPRQGAALPVAYVDALQRATATVCKTELGR
jgi:hypothetical protein